MLKKVGYARVAGLNPDLLQQEMRALKKAGCKYIFVDKAGDIRHERPKLKEALNYLQEGDVLIVSKLAVIGQSITNLIEIVSYLYSQGIRFKSLHDNIDTSNENSEMIFQVFSALAEYERDIVQERALSGLVSARARGRNGGRPKALEPEQIEAIKKLHADKNNSITNICKMFKISRPTLYAYLKG